MPKQGETVPLRDRREALTLRTILSAARGLFAERGYARTPIREIAARAGVVPQTVYAHFGSKAGVLGGLVDLLDDEADIVGLFAAAEDVGDPVELLGLLARVNRMIMQRCGDIVAMLSSGAAVDPDIAATEAEGLRRNRNSVESIIDRIRATGQPVAEKAADIIVALMSAEVHNRLVIDADWSHDDYEVWLKNTLAALILRTDQ
ncbi:MAG TPA: helix-turn-helix domain-containing protein [Pseudonocardiaceae bacterium]|nr:helix-turn-helix domain-containing protein [Pseudonocardiaceae bacterium]